MIELGEKSRSLKESNEWESELEQNSGKEKEQKLHYTQMTNNIDNA